MSHNHWQAFIPIICLTVNVLVQVISFRYIANLKLLKSIFTGYAVGLATIFILELYVFFIPSIPVKDFFSILAVNIITYSSLSYCYFHFLNLGETARRIRILMEIYDSKDGLSMDEILIRYNAKEIIERRINRLINSGQVIYKDGRYFIGNPIMLLMSKIIIAMKLILLGKKSEFD